ncbi:RagB/SusD family nutrient uptake outer membrane protein [Mucilaginibacter sp. HC2]|uniref:RagB/SusD family nutrient uptake outer membrane protein n=1 Tax=Mucilaginibacter inviolabilis TaxID=2714892 RepID=UPI0014097BF7|nr:RagB/SusD family nutrient uptake outer membrane protein [Mucilaginibacter inviolabilis]NHA07834.1 RagB/SusD family nutrient uptake outer membrane protein [Mucilaginibacter inviolabilis]
MKKILSVTFLTLMITVSGCKKLLDQPPKSQLGSDKFWKNADDAKAGVAGIYDGVQDMFNSQFIYWGDGRSDNLTFHPTYNDGLPLAINVLTPNTNGADWTLLYTTISRANFAIKYIPTIPVIDPALSKDYQAQALGIRAYCYFWLIRLWGNVPLWTEPYEDLSTDPYKGVTPAADIMKNEILPDLLKAYDLSDKTASVVWNLNSGGIAAMLMDVYMYNHDYTNALLWCDNLLALKRYSLEPTATWKNIFTSPTNSKEDIWSLNWDFTVDGGNKTSQEIGAGDTNSDFAVDPALWTYFTTTTADIRGAQSIDFKVNNHDKIWKYYAPNLDKNGNQIYPNSPQANLLFPLYRLADIYLLRAEALNRTGDLTNALVYLNMVHTRAGLPAYKASDFTSADDMLYGNPVNGNGILRERQLEFFCEAKRWFDLQRNGIIVSIMDPLIKARQVQKGFPPTGFGDIRKIFWPINQNVLNANTKLTQNPPY